MSTQRINLSGLETYTMHDFIRGLMRNDPVAITLYDSNEKLREVLLPIWNLVAYRTGSEICLLRWDPECPELHDFVAKIQKQKETEQHNAMINKEFQKKSATPVKDALQAKVQAKQEVERGKMAAMTVEEATALLNKK